MILTLIFGLLFLVLISLLFIPIELYLNTITNQYYVQLRGLVKVSIEIDKKELLRVRLQVFFRSYYFYPLRKNNSSKTKKIREKKHLKSRNKINFKTVLRLLKSFKVKEFVLHIDTGNSILNAKLYPAFSFLNYHIGNININFEDRNQLVLCMQNRPIHIIKSFINF